MRLTSRQIDIVRATVQDVAGGADVWLFGSRLDERRRGGDVDLLVQSKPPLDLLRRARLKYRLERELGLPVDVTVAEQDAEPGPFARLAMAEGVKL